MPRQIRQCVTAPLFGGDGPTVSAPGLFDDNAPLAVAPTVVRARHVRAVPERVEVAQRGQREALMGLMLTEGTPECGFGFALGEVV